MIMILTLCKAGYCESSSCEGIGTSYSQGMSLSSSSWVTVSSSESTFHTLMEEL